MSCRRRERIRTAKDSLQFQTVIGILNMILGPKPRQQIVAATRTCLDRRMTLFRGSSIVPIVIQAKVPVVISVGLNGRNILISAYQTATGMAIPTHVLMMTTDPHTGLRHPVLTFVDTPRTRNHQSQTTTQQIIATCLLRAPRRRWLRQTH